MANNKDFKVKNGIQPTVYNEGVGTVVSGSVGYYLSEAVYDNVSFSIASQDTNPYGMAFNTDGTKMYVVGLSTVAAHQYSLSTAFDLSTASYDSVSFGFTSQDNQPFDMTFNADGTKMYMLGNVSDSVYQYSLSTAFDLSTASYDSVSFSVASQSNTPISMAFSSDGTKMYVLDLTNDNVFQYDLSTAFDLSTASYSSVSFSVSSQDTNPYDIVFSSDGTKMYMVGTVSASVYQYNLSTAFDLSTASYSSVNFSVLSQNNDPSEIVFGSAGTKMYMLGRSSQSIYQYSTVLNTASLDLSTGAVFDYTPTSDVQVTVSNPAASGTVSSATLLLTGAEASGIGSTFSTTLYTGNESTNTITNNIDLSTDGGLVWVKDRNQVISHGLFDTERGIYKVLASDGTLSEETHTTSLTAFNSDGFTLGNRSDYNGLSRSYVSWTFKKAAKFFDIVTYTGNGATQNVSHNLGSDVGMLIIKSTSAGNWFVWHRSLGDNAYLFLNGTNTQQLPGFDWIDVTSTTISLQNNSSNTNGQTFVAYLFAHDTASDGLIQCGSFVNDLSSVNVEVNLGWEPQWLLIKGASSGSGLGHWYIYDNSRTGQVLSPNQSAAESADTSFTFTSNGFTPTTNFNGTLIYIAIRNPYIPTITYDTDLEWSGGTAPTAPAEGETDVITINTRDGGTTYQAIQAIDGAK